MGDAVAGDTFADATLAGESLMGELLAADDNAVLVGGAFVETAGLTRPSVEPEPLSFGRARGELDPGFGGGGEDGTSFGDGADATLALDMTLDTLALRIMGFGGSEVVRDRPVTGDCGVPVGLC